MAINCVCHCAGGILNSLSAIVVPQYRLIDCWRCWHCVHFWNKVKCFSTKKTDRTNKSNIFRFCQSQISIWRLKPFYMFIRHNNVVSSGSRSSSNKSRLQTELNSSSKHKPKAQTMALPTSLNKVSDAKDSSIGQLNWNVLQNQQILTLNQISDAVDRNKNIQSQFIHF